MLNITDNHQIGVLGDTHGLDWVTTAAMRSLATYTDTLIQVGDFHTYSNSKLRNLSSVSKRTGVKLYFIPGNHENWDYLDSVSTEEIVEISPGVFYCPIGSRALINNKKVLFCGGAVSVDKAFRTPGFDWFPQETISISQAYSIVDEGEADIMFTHDCPSRVDMPEGCFMNDSENIFGQDIMKSAHNHREILDSIVGNVKPSVLLHGHYHYYYKDKKDGLITLGLSLENHKGALILLDTDDYSHIVLDPRYDSSYRWK